MTNAMRLFPLILAAVALFLSACDRHEWESTDGGPSVKDLYTHGGDHGGDHGDDHGDGHGKGHDDHKGHAAEDAHGDDHGQKKDSH